MTVGLTFTTSLDACPLLVSQPFSACSGNAIHAGSTW
jgi:hypothetical protein